MIHRLTVFLLVFPLVGFASREMLHAILIFDVVVVGLERAESCKFVIRFAVMHLP